MGDERPLFALTGLASRGGLSNWVLFFFPSRLVMVDVGMRPAIVAGVVAGIGANLTVIETDSSYGPQRGEGQGLDAWHRTLREEAKRTRDLADDDVVALRLHMRAMAHELHLTERSGVTTKLTLMNRDEGERASELLRDRYGPRFEASSTRAFSFFQRHAPWLMK